MPYTNLRRGRYSASGMTYHITTVTKSRLPLFLDLRPARIVVCQLKALQDEGLAETLSYVLMPDHLYWLMTLRSGELSGVMRLLKGRTARTLGQPIWQSNYHDHALRKDEDLRALVQYIVANPVRAGLVDRIGDYPWWDAIWLDAVLSG